MGRLPDLTPLFYWAAFGLLAAAALVVGGGGWALYHVIRALAAYIGA